MRGVRTIIASMALVAVLSVPSVALAKSYEIADLRIEASFDANGDLRIDESRTFDFSGAYHWVEWRLNTKGSDGVEVLGLSAVDGGDVPFRRVDGEATHPGP